MEFGAPSVWWILAGGLVAVELATGSFYLLMLALGAAVAALVAHAGLGLSAQLAAAGLVGGGAVAAWHRLRQRSPQNAPAASNRDVNLDIGERVHVSAWLADGTASVTYRGAQWSARHAGGGEPQPGEHVIQSIEGSRLVLAA